MAQDKPWHDIIAVSALEPNWVTRVTLGPRKLAIYDTPGGIYASLALCNHGGADLCDGYFDGYVIECPLHQGAFDVRDGKPVCAPATKPMRVFETRVADGMVQIQM
jgi:3-phenylpropionate/trans-cinnamate dioxygenase ferredoxin subunit/naphthalene 1,2-dioxygenase system ferredoxin subunit